MARVLRSVGAGLLAVFIVGIAFAAGKQLRAVRVGHAPLHHRISVASEKLHGLLQGDGEAVAVNGDPADTLQEVLRYVRSEYVDRIGDEGKLSVGTMRAMLASLDDPRTRYYDTKQRTMLEAQMAGKFSGIGVLVAVIKQKRDEVEQRRLMVTSAVSGGPADKAGVKAGDIITEIDGHWVIAYDPRLDLNRLQTRTMDDRTYRSKYASLTKRLNEGIMLGRALERVNSNEANQLKLTIERAGSPAALHLTVKTGDYKLDPVTVTNGPATVLRISQFNDEAAAQITQALSSSTDQPLVVDLRGNAGGPVTDAKSGVQGAAAKLVGCLTGGRDLGTVLMRGKTEGVGAVAGTRHTGKVAVLIDRGTANIAEVAAAAINEKLGAPLVGERTAGDAARVRYLQLQAGGSMTITSGRFQTTKGVNFADKGLQPTVAIAATGSGDAALDRAIQLVTGKGQG